MAASVLRLKSHPSLLLMVVVMVLVVVVFPTVGANIAEFDEYWKEREKQAKSSAIAAFQPNPEDVSNEFNNKVANTVLEKNGTVRRSLRGYKQRYKGPCLATNPIDKCWRCRQNWAAHRKRLASCAIGFARGTTGGKKGNFYFVHDSSDDELLEPKPGTLRHAVIQLEPLWIVFSRSMIITLQEELIMTGDKTIDGRGVNVHIAYGSGITIQYISNVIIHGLHIHDIVPKEGGKIRDSVIHWGERTRSDGDGISVFGSSYVWIDHNSMWNCADGMIDVIEASTGVTISNNHFTKHNDVMLLGADDNTAKDAIMQVTIAFNHFGKGLVQRMPRCRWGFFHIVNNDYTHWDMYAVGGSAHPTIISQGNRYRASPNFDPQHANKEVTKRDDAFKEEEWRQWTWRSDGDLMLNGAFFVESGEPLKSHPFTHYQMIKAHPGHFVMQLTHFAGALSCRRKSPC